MVAYCAAFNCQEKAVKGGVSFHSFPKDARLCKQWVSAMKRKDFVASKHSKLCGKHFSPDSFNTSPWSSLRVLKPDAVPTIFDFPEHMMKPEKQRNPPKARGNSGSSAMHYPEALCTAHASEGMDRPIVNNQFSEQPVQLPSHHTIDEEITDTTLEEPSISVSHDENQSRKRKSYMGDFSVDDMASPRKAKKYMDRTLMVIKKKSRQIKSLQKQKTRLKKCVGDLQTLVAHLKTKQLLSNEVALVLNTMPADVQELFKRTLNNSNKKYPECLKTFALTLSFYSPKAYDYVRRVFQNALPHPRTLQKWYMTVGGNPGFTEEAISAIRRKVLGNEASGKPTVCALMMDEMSIRQQVEWTGKELSGFVDFGGELDCDNIREAKNVLVLMLNCVNGKWKIPVAYFFIESLGSEERAHLVIRCLNILHQTGVIVKSVTFDGLAANLAMISCLGGEIIGTPRKAWFPHPDTSEKVFLILDPCHMLKLIRNTLASWGEMKDEDGGKIQWAYIKKLVQIQEEEGLHLANKLTRRHINWEREKMKVKTAAQTLSRSTSKALQYLREVSYGGLSGTTEPTEKFLLHINDAFDILNSRNIFCKGFKGGLTKRNYSFVSQRIAEIHSYITGLTNATGTLLTHTARKIGFVGFLSALETVEEMYLELVEERALMDYFLSYKISQDHLEVFFSAVRSKGGYNNNPTAIQFSAAYKRLVFHADVSGPKTANCLEDTPTSVLPVTSETNSSICVYSPSYDFSLQEKSIDDCALQERQSNDHDYEMPYDKLSPYVVDIVAYIAGFVVAKLMRVVKCGECLKALTCDEQTLLVKIKSFTTNDSAGLVRASYDVIQLCKVAERVFRGNESSIIGRRNIVSSMCSQVLHDVTYTELFSCLNEHMFQEVAQGNHVVLLMKNITREYLNIRLHHMASLMNQKSEKPRVRSTLTKAIHFKNQ